MKKLAIGIDIGGTRTKIGLVDLTIGQVLQTTIQATETLDAVRFEQAIGEAIQTLKAKAAVLQADVLGIGIGVSSFVHADGLVDSTYGFIDFMEDYPLANIIQTQHALPCRIDNDARLVALGEALYGRGRGLERVLVLTLGTGLGLGFVIKQKLDGKLPFAHMGGHLSIVQNGVKCYCGKTGCLESLVSATGILAAAERANWSAKNPSLPFTVESIFQASAAGNTGARELIDAFIEQLKTGISNYINLYAPDVIVLGGGVAKGLAPYLPRLLDEDLLGPYKGYQTSITISELEEQAGILGAAALFL
ncbi:ROK family protein [Haliscomenobacter sp.]|uniref:ROK family protein n=1 Tax=Haliscomenobacter sp. TaxID=2717303 RepID=UPI0035942906